MILEGNVCLGARLRYGICVLGRIPKGVLVNSVDATRSRALETTLFPNKCRPRGTRGDQSNIASVSSMASVGVRRITDVRARVLASAFCESPQGRAINMLVSIKSCERALRD